MVRSHHVSLEEMNSLFICQEHSGFHSYRFTGCSSFSATAFGFHFRLDLCSDLVISFHQGVFLPLVFIGFHQRGVYKKFEWCWKREKALCKKVVQEQKRV
jgi:hypothetical protein